MLKNFQFVGASVPTIQRGEPSIIADVPMIFQGTGTYPANVIEYAGRACYRSTSKMGLAPDFIPARIREGHNDILEHSWLSLVADIPYPAEFFKRCRFLWADPVGDEQYLVSGGFRAWLDYFKQDSGVLSECALAAPSIFDEKIEPAADGQPIPIAPRRVGQAKVVMLSVHKPIHAYDMRNGADHCAATFMIEGVSRTFSHQLVRHRLGSFSQESQRYVDLEKGGWSAITPPAIRGDAQKDTVFSAFWAQAELTYKALRELGARKEDARFVLPSAAETRLVVTLSLSGWQHFLALRDAKDAQWEIHGVAQAVKAMLLEAGLPVVVVE